jgi:hypothetical protein
MDIKIQLNVALRIGESILKTFLIINVSHRHHLLSSWESILLPVIQFLYPHEIIYPS